MSDITKALQLAGDYADSLTTADDDGWTEHGHGPWRSPVKESA